ncbi:unnamed protein product [Vicia faba]|uniref:non-specific serine/threonine protein kinase n=1 Tax=Vicia faba TaxID=3906 RepID=A0AAV1A3S4_VICFA|nr:unnamed protein product [Vicia faba]
MKSFSNFVLVVVMSNKIKPLSCRDTGSVHLVELRDTSELYAMKAMEKSEMMNRNKVHRACIEREIISLLYHPFIITTTDTHACLITDFCPRAELFALLGRQPMKILKEDSARFYPAEVVIGLEYLHCLGTLLIISSIYLFTLRISFSIGY